MEAILWKSLCQTFWRLQITSNLCNSQWLGVYDLCHTFLQVSIAQVKTRTTRITMCNKIWSLWPLPTVQDYFWPPRKKTIIHLIQNSEIRSFTLKMVWNISRASQVADKSPVLPFDNWKYNSDTLQTRQGIFPELLEIMLFAPSLLFHLQCKIGWAWCWNPGASETLQQGVPRHRNVAAHAHQLH